MLVPHLLAAYVFVGLSLFVLGFLLSRQAPQSTAPRFVAVVTGIWGVVSWAFAVLLWMESRHVATILEQIPDRTYAESSTGSQEQSHATESRRAGAAALTAIRLAGCGAGRLCDTARHTEDRLRHARRLAWESWC